MLKQHPRGHLYFANVPTHIPLSDETSPARAAHVDLAWRDPEAARRERLRAQLGYWRRRLQSLHERTELLRALLGQPELEDGAPAADRWRARIELTAAEGDMLAAAWRLQRLQQDLGEKSAPLPPAPAPATLPPAEPKKPGPKITCECGTCARCRAREAMRRRRAAAKAARKARAR